MSEKELGKAMLRLDPASDKPLPSADLLRYLLTRDRRRARFLTVVVLLIWAVVVFFLYGTISFWYDYVIPQHKELLTVTAKAHEAGSVARYQSVAISDLNLLFFSVIALPRAIVSGRALRVGGASFCEEKYRARSLRSGLVSFSTNGFMTALSRRPSRYMNNAVTRNWRGCPASEGNADEGELPSAPWQAAQTCAFCRPSSKPA